MLHPMTDTNLDKKHVVRHHQQEHDSSDKPVPEMFFKEYAKRPIDSLR